MTEEEGLKKLPVAHTCFNRIDLPPYAAFGTPCCPRLAQHAAPFCTHLSCCIRCFRFLGVYFHGITSLLCFRNVAKIVI